MPFKKLDLCRSTQIALNVFHMLRNNTVNLAYVGKSKRLVQHDAEKDWKPDPEEPDEVKPFDNKKFLFLSRLLTGDCPQIRIHDVKESLNRRDRLVEFRVKPDHLDYHKVILLVAVEQYARTYRVPKQSWSDWRLRTVDAKLLKYGLEDWKTEVETMHMLCTEAEDHEEFRLSDQMKRDVGGLLFFCPD